MKFAVTGAGGLIGRFLVDRLADDGHEVIAIFRGDVPADFSGRENIRCARGDVMDSAFLDKAFRQIDGVFHAAAFTKPWTRDKTLYRKVNVEGTDKVCAACVACGVKRLVYTSSAGVHGPQQGDALVDEQTFPTAYDTLYEESKFHGMQKAFSYTNKGLEVVALSPARVYASRVVRESNVPVRMMKIYLKNRFGFVPANGQGVGSYVHMDDIVQGHLFAMEKGISGEEYLLGGENVSYLAFFDAVATATGKHYPVFKIPYPLSLFIGKSQLFMAEAFGIPPKITTPWVRRYLKNWGVNSAKARTLGYDPIPLSEGLRQVYRATFWGK